MPKRGDVERFGVSLQPTFIQEHGEIYWSMRCDNRSKVVHNAVRGFITNVQWMKQGSGFVSVSSSMFQRVGTLDERRDEKGSVVF